MCYVPRSLLYRRSAVAGRMGFVMSSGVDRFLSGLLLGGLLFILSSFAWAGGSEEKVGVVVRPAVSGLSAPVAKVAETKSEPADEREMVASYYGRDFAGEATATGEPFDPEGYTAAHKSLPLGTEVGVSYGGEWVRVVINDRGPYIEGRDIDLSLAAAQEIGLIEPGSAPVRVAVL